MKVIIIGAGEVGYHLAYKLSKEDYDVILIEKNKEKIKLMQEKLDIQVIEGSGSNVALLKQAGIEQADIVLAVTNSDEVNLLACLITESFSPSCVTVARIKDPDYSNLNNIFDKERLNIDFVVNPEKEIINNVLSILTMQGATDYREFAGGRVKLVSYRLEADSFLAGKKLLELKGMFKERFLIAAVCREKEMIVPRGNDYLKPKDEIFIFTDKETIPQLNKILRVKEFPVNNIVIYGGNNAGYWLASALEEKNLSVKLIEPDKEICLQLAEKLNNTIILNGDATDKNLLLEENINRVDLFIAVTDDEEDNILVSLLAKSLGAKRAFTRINKPSYLPLVSTLGISMVISESLAAVSRIMGYIRKDRITSTLLFHEDDTRIIEFTASEGSSIVNVPLKKLNLMQGTLVGAVIRGNRLIIPDGETVILSKDKVIMFTNSSVISQLEEKIR